MPRGGAELSCYGVPMNRTAMTLLLAALAGNLAACAAPGEYPSLARRPLERPETAASAPVPAAPTLPDAALSARLSRLVDQAGAAHARFQQRRAHAEQAVSAGAGAATGSEGWAVANVALAGLESSRSEAMLALAELDQLTAADRVAHYNELSGDGIAIAAARERVFPLIDEEDRVLSALRGRLGS